MGFVFIFFLKVLLFQSCIFLNIYIKDPTWDYQNRSCGFCFALHNCASRGRHRVSDVKQVQQINLVCHLEEWSTEHQLPGGPS